MREAQCNKQHSNCVNSYKSKRFICNSTAVKIFSVSPHHITPKLLSWLFFLSSSIESMMMPRRICGVAA